MNNDDFMSFFSNITSGQSQNSNPKSIQDMTDELDYLWEDYQDYLSRVKENYKVMRNINRIAHLLVLLGKLWKRNSDLRFAQIIEILKLKLGTDDMFYVEKERL